MRFALLEAKLAMMSIIHKFELTKSERTQDKIVLDPSAALGAPKDPIYLKFIERSTLSK